MEKSEKNTSNVGKKIPALVASDAHKCSAIAFCIKVILQEAHASLRSLLMAMEDREACEREESGQTPRLGRRKPTRMKPGHVPPGQVESGLTMPSHEGRAMVTGERKNPKDLNARAFSGN